MLLIPEDSISPSFVICSCYNSKEDSEQHRQAFDRFTSFAFMD
jgi:hypothetical protein